MNKPTQKQLDFIYFMEGQTGIKFTGKTKKEASKYIDENKSKIPHDAYESDWAIVNGY
jgi:ribosomal protein L10